MRRPAGCRSTSCSTRTVPETNVPVTTVPKPRMEKARSMGKRKYWEESFSRIDVATFSISKRSSSRPAPVVELTATTGAPSKNDPRTNSSASRRTSSIKSESARSDLVSTIMPFLMPSNRQMSKCSRVCGLMDSSAAITKRTRSMPPTPASIFLMNLSCPGTSTKARRRFSESSRCANPKSMEIPRCFSSLSRSVSMPVRARTKAVLPWSIWPAVPIMMFFISTLFILSPLGAKSLAPAGAQGGDVPIFKAGVADVRIDVLVTENKDLVKGLAKEDFVVTDEGQPQNVVSFSNGDEQLNLILLLDISGSMQKNIELISETARDALNHLRPGDRVAIMVFAKTSEVHQDFSDNLAETARQISKAVQNHNVGNTTQINAAVVDAAHYMQAHAGPGGSRAILILTDNLSMSYQLTDGQVIRELNKADTVFNVIVTGHAIEPKALEPGKGNPDFTPADVFHLSEETGGEWVKAEQAGVSFNEMIGHIRSRYSL